MDNGTQTTTQYVGEYFVPEDPMDAFQCESCQ
ncbi:ribonucleotide-diphosphate reductase subunit beta [Planctomonas sp. JC2975]|nr:ribonucleotide-diphosphate reductase subunit beta [Planctomonas sp. JC2975]NNC11479.1 ribonucleotide-diphosphate reductase subunit beta [Planctomonas sp. JC2975]